MATTFHTVVDAPAGLPNARVSTTGGNLTAGQTSFGLEPAGIKLPASPPYWITIDAEQIEVLARDGASITSCVRGANGTTATTHAAGASVWLNVNAAQVQEMQDAITALEGGGASNFEGRITDLEAQAAKLDSTGNFDAEVSAPAFNGLAFKLNGSALSLVHMDDVHSVGRTDGQILQWDEDTGTHVYADAGVADPFTGSIDSDGTAAIHGAVRLGNDEENHPVGAERAVLVRHSEDSVSGTFYGVESAMLADVPNGSGTATGRYFGGSFVTQLRGNADYSNSIVGLYGEASNAPTGYEAALVSGVRGATYRGMGGAATDARAVEAATYGSSGTFTNAAGLYVWTQLGATNNYGVYVEAQTGATNNYAIYTNAGKVRLGDAVDAVGLLTAQAGVNVPAGQTYKVDGAQIGLSNGLADAAVSSPSPGHVMVRNASNTAFVNVPISGDATLADTGALSLTNSGVEAGSYRKVTVDAKGRVTAGSNPTYMINLPGGAACPAETGGCADPARVSVGNTPYFVPSFDGGAVNEAWFCIPLPANYGGGAFTPTVHYLPTGTGGHTWDIAGCAIADNGSADVSGSLGTAVVINDTPGGANTDCQATGSALTLGGTPAAGNLAVFRVRRRGDTDAATAAAYLIAFKLEYTPA